MLFRNFLLVLLLCLSTRAYSQQDIDFHLNAHLLAGKKVLRVKRDFYDPYLWVLAQNNQVYRINSETMAVDDYTAAFSAYNGHSFVDIAGRSKDTVFIASNSTGVIEYNKGTIHLITAADGVPYAANAIGIEKKNGFGIDPNSLLITTNSAYGYYDFKAENPVTFIDSSASKVFETTYRKEMFKDSSVNTSNFITDDSVQFLPATFKGEGTVFNEFLWEGGKTFGYDINTAYYVTASIYDYNIVVDETNLFWGNSRGLFENNSDQSYRPDINDHLHYLNGINVNKITGMYGLVAFGNGKWIGDPRYIRENLLVGTDKGLYFSTSVYLNNIQTGVAGLRELSMSHYDELGNVVINDISVNAASINVPICEDGAWLAADDGLYYIKPDYSKYVSSTKFQLINFNSQDKAVNETQICAGSTVLAVGNTQLYAGKTVQWYKNGQELPGEGKDTLAITTAGDYHAIFYDPCADIHLESNHLRVTVAAGPVFSFHYPDRIQHCDNTSDTLMVDDNPGYHYRWYTNGVLNDDTTASFIVTQTGKYKIEVSACTDGWVPSKEVEVDFIALPIPQITSDKTVYCAEDIANLSVNIPVDPSYVINWYRNGTLLPEDKELNTVTDAKPGSYTVVLSSTTSKCAQTSNPFELTFIAPPVLNSLFADELRSCSAIPLTANFTGAGTIRYRWYTNGTLNGDTTAQFNATQTGKYKVEASVCAESWISSNETQVDIFTLPVASISGDKPAYCLGDNATLSISAPASPLYTINWYKDNVLIGANTNQQSIITNLPGSYSVSIINNLANSDGTFCTQTLAALPLTFNPPLTISIEKIIKTTLCDGEAIELVAHHNSGTVKWSTGETSDQISVDTDGDYKLTVTSPAGCQEEARVTVAFFQNPVFSVKDTSICTYKGQPITLTAPSGYAQYAWNGRPGSQTYRVSQPQIVELTVTDANGCQATQPIKVLDHCPDIWIPNTFTPNGDGVNDTWTIEGLDKDKTVLVRVFTRYGTKIYESKGYGIPWNGEYEGKKLPAGVYYYIVAAKNGTQKFSGSLTIIY